MPVTSDRLWEWLEEKLEEGFEIHLSRNIVGSITLSLSNLKTLQTTKVFVELTPLLAFKSAYEDDRAKGIVRHGYKAHDPDDEFYGCDVCGLEKNNTVHRSH